MAEKKDAPAAKAAPKDDRNLSTMGDEDGKVTNRVEGTIQSEPTPEEMPSDAKIAPINEQIAPNQASLAVGALAQPEEIAGVEQPEEGQKVVTSDMSKTAEFLSTESNQDEEAKLADEQAKRDADKAKL